MKPNCFLESWMTKLLSILSERIYGMHNLESGGGSYGYLKMLMSFKSRLFSFGNWRIHFWQFWRPLPPFVYKVSQPIEVIQSRTNKSIYLNPDYLVLETRLSSFGKFSPALLDVGVLVFNNTF